MLNNVPLMAAYKAEGPIKPDADGYWQGSAKPEKAREASNLGGSGPDRRSANRAGVSNVCETGISVEDPRAARMGLLPIPQPRAQSPDADP
ncbi:hypothetical protein GCM10011491_42860 [Brucella endophytica]|uniref:Uncharacterized protein n=1 Tax=Brucella endophytica TaxID=1963359 RepID=A0A916WL33_9HYPH|nr:hypothetical protein GCM10011491_42860 [Brucella endophytica]